MKTIIAAAALLALGAKADAAIISADFSVSYGSAAGYPYFSAIEIAKALGDGNELDDSGLVFNPDSDPYVYLQDRVFIDLSKDGLLTLTGSGPLAGEDFEMEYGYILVSISNIVFSESMRIASVRGLMSDLLGFDYSMPDDPSFIYFTANSVLLRWDTDMFAETYPEDPPYLIDVRGGGVSTYQFELVPVPVPLPATAPMLLIGAALLGVGRRLKG